MTGTGSPEGNGGKHAVPIGLKIYWVSEADQVIKGIGMKCGLINRIRSLNNTARTEFLVIISPDGDFRQPDCIKLKIIRVCPVGQENKK
jgi:hypothetical protein